MGMEHPRLALSVYVFRNSLYILFAVSLLLPQLVSANSFKLEPALSVREEYTDNIRIAQTGFEESDLVTMLTPGLSMDYESRKIQTNLNYTLQTIIYSLTDIGTTYNNLLDTSSTISILEPNLFLDGSVKLRPQNINTSGRRSTDIIVDSSDRENVLTYEIEPTYKQRFGQWFSTELSYKVNDISAKTRSSDQDTTNVIFNSGDYFNKILWDFSFKNEDSVTEVNNMMTEDTRLRTYDGTFRYLYSRKLAFTVNVGYDDNDYSSRSKVSGEYWKIGPSWNPSQRISLEFLAGTRFFGTDISANINYISKRFRIDLTYKITPQASRSGLTDQSVFDLEDQFGDIIENPDISNPSLLEVSLPTETPEVYVNNELSTSFRYFIKKHTFNIRANFSDREYQQTGQSDERFYGIMSWNWNINEKIGSTLIFNYEDYSTLSGEDNQLLNISYRFSWRFSQKLSATLGYKYAEQQSSLDFNNYSQYSVFSSLNARF